jgi:hypothetical protein
MEHLREFSHVGFFVVYPAQSRRPKYEQEHPDIVARDRGKSHSFCAEVEHDAAAALFVSQPLPTKTYSAKNDALAAPATVF